MQHQILFLKQAIPAQKQILKKKIEPETSESEPVDLGTSQTLGDWSITASTIDFKNETRPPANTERRVDNFTICGYTGNIKRARCR